MGCSCTSSSNSPRTQLQSSYSVLRDLRRFAIEALCLLMSLYGAPLQALESSPDVDLGLAEQEERLGDGDDTPVVSRLAATIEPLLTKAQKKAFFYIRDNSFER